MPCEKQPQVKSNLSIPRNRLSSIEGMDVAGRADGVRFRMGFIWLPTKGIPAIYQKKLGRWWL